MKKVEIYTGPLCGYCAAAKRLLSNKGIAYVEYDTSKKIEIRQEMMQRSNGGRTVPQIFIGDEHIGGSDELHVLERAGKLDQMLAV